MSNERTLCPLCGGTTGISGHPTRRDSCAACGADLHACNTCCLHDARAHNQCREPKAEWQPKRDRANYCDFFELAQGGPADNGNNAAEQKRQTALDDLFKNF